MNRGSYIVIFTYLYVLLILPLLFKGTSPAWTSYYWLVMQFKCLAALLFNFIKNKTDIERAYLTFIITQTIFNVAYYLIMITFCDDPNNTPRWIGVTYFLGTMFVAALIAFNKMKPWKESL